MRQQFLFDLQLLWMKKNRRLFLLFLNLCYMLLGVNICFFNSYRCILLTIIVATFNTFIILGIANCNGTKNHQTKSNYSLCIYYPIKRWHFYVSKSLLTILVLFIQLILTTIMIFIACQIHQVDFEWNIIYPYLSAIFIIVSIGSSIIVVTCFSAGAFQLGSILTFTFIGMVCGFFMGYFEDNDTYMKPMILWVVMLICCGIWLLSHLLAYFISKHISK